VLGGPKKKKKKKRKEGIFLTREAGMGRSRNPSGGMAIRIPTAASLAECGQHLFRYSRILAKGKMRQGSLPGGEGYLTLAKDGLIPS